MDTDQIGLFSFAEKRLGYLDQRQILLAKDIANATTPSWRDQDLKPFDATLSAFAAAGDPEQTNPMHFSGTLGGPMKDRMLRPAEKAPDGNAVSLQADMVKMADTDSAHELVTNLYKTYVGMFNTALGK